MTLATSGATGIAGSLTARTALISIGQGTVKASQLIITLALVRVLSPGEWTRTAYLLSIHLAAVTIGTLNLQHTIVFFIRHLGPGFERRLVAQTAGCLAVVGLAIALVLLVARPALSGGRLAVGSALPWICIAIALEIPAACGANALVAVDDLARAAAWDVLTTVVQAAAVIGAALAGRGVTAVAIGLAVAAAIRLGLFSVVLARLPGGAGRPAAGTLRRQLRYGLPLGLALGTAVLNRSVDKWFVAVFDTGNVGVYSVAAQEIPLLAVVPYAAGAAIVGALVDAFRHHDTTSALELWLRLTGTMSAVVVPVSAALMLITPQLFAVLFEAEFGAGVLSFQLFAAISLHRVAEYGLVLRSADRTRDLLWSSAVLLGSNVVLAGIGASLAGMSGAAAGTLLANGVAWIFVLGRLTDVFGVRMRHVFAWRAWLRTLGCAVGAFVGASATLGLLPRHGPLVELVLGLTVFAAIHLLLARPWRDLTRTEADQLRTATIAKASR